MSDENKQPEIGDVWQRRNKRRVHLTSCSTHRAITSFEMKPLDGGRTAWKESRRIAKDMTYLCRIDELADAEEAITATPQDAAIGVGDTVIIESSLERGVVVWVQPDGWMQAWDKREAMGGWLDRLSEVCQDDLRRIGEERGRWLSKNKVCDHDKLRAIIRLEQRTKRAGQGIPAGSVRYDWRRVSRLRLVKRREEA